MASTAPVGIEIVERIASRENVDPMDLDIRLYDAINPDALDALTNGSDDQQTQGTCRVEFTYHGYEVNVNGAGGITIDEQEPQGQSDEPAEERVAGD